MHQVWKFVFHCGFSPLGFKPYIAAPMELPVFTVVSFCGLIAISCDLCGWRDHLLEFCLLYGDEPGAIGFHWTSLTWWRLLGGSIQSSSCHCFHRSWRIWEAMTFHCYHSRTVSSTRVWPGARPSNASYTERASPYGLADAPQRQSQTWILYPAKFIAPLP